MDVALALGETAEKLGVVVAAGAAAASLILPERRERAIAMTLAVVTSAAVLVGHIWNSDQFRSISGDAFAFTAVLVLALAVTGCLAVLFLRVPAAFPILAVTALPFRILIEAGGSTANLLVPLYVVIAGATAAYAWAQARRADHERQPATVLELALALFLALYALQSLYSRDFDKALEQVAFFYVPFALLFCQLREVRWTRALLAGCAATLVVLALTFSAIGFWEYDHRELLWNPKVINANQFESYFRVNSVFWDPNIYGRFLAVVMVAVAAVVLWSRGVRTVAVGAVALAVLWGGLVFSFSQSSIASLLAGLAVLAALRWDPKRTAVACAVGVAMAVLFVVLFQDALRLHLGSSSGLNKATSGRVDLIKGGAELFTERPVWGHGSGAFARAYRQEGKGSEEQATSASHTQPITVAAEQGLIGLGGYLFVVGAALALLLAGRGGRAPPVLISGDGAVDARESRALLDRSASLLDPTAHAAAHAALSAAFVTLLVHTMMYAAFLEDPLVWVVLALGLVISPHARLAEQEQPSTVPAAAPALATR